MTPEKFLNRKILLIRHGRTDWNDVQRFQGSSDIPLNATGIVQADKLAKRLAAWPIDTLYTSPLIRAVQTASAIASFHSLSPLPLCELSEVNFGSWEGSFLKHLKETEAENFNTWLQDPFFNMPSGAETWPQIEARVQKAINVIFSEKHSHVAIVSHVGTMRALFSVLLKLDPHSVWKIKTSNCSITGIEVHEFETSLAFSNDDLHLRGLPESIPLPVW